MGFLKNIFKRKKGGTLVGNLLRGASSSVTGGILGSGAGLAKWEQEQAQNEMEAFYKANQGREIGANLVNKVAVPAMANSQGSDSTIGDNVMKESLKKHWLYVVAGLGTVIGGTYFITRKATGKKGKVK